jgi:hypothetical protein
MYARSNCCGGCPAPITLNCGDDYLKVDGRALAFGDDGSWPDTIVAVQLVFESYDGAHCSPCGPKCSLSVMGTIYDIGCVPGFPTGANMLPISDCGQQNYGFAYLEGCGKDPAATVPLVDCDGKTGGWVYPAPTAIATQAVTEGCGTSPVVVGYAVNKLSNIYYSPAGVVRPGEQRTAWFDLTAAQTRRLGAFASYYKVIGITESGARVTLQQGAYL